MPASSATARLAGSGTAPGSRGCFIGPNNPPHEIVPHDVAFFEDDMTNPFEARQKIDGLSEP